MTAADLLDACRGRGVTFSAQGDRLRFRAPKGVLTDPDRAALGAAKTDVIRLLAAENRLTALRDTAEAIRRSEFAGPWPTDLAAVVADLLGLAAEYARGQDAIERLDGVETLLRQAVAHQQSRPRSGGVPPIDPAEDAADTRFTERELGLPAGSVFFFRP